jgi:hypothetical protein
MTLAGTFLALALSALPFPPPRVAPVTSSTKCDRATVLLVDSAKGELKGTTTAGVVTYRISQDVQVFDKAGKPAGAATGLAAGAKIRVYYVIDDGAKVQEVDLTE